MQLQTNIMPLRLCYFKDMNTVATLHNTLTASAEVYFIQQREVKSMQLLLLETGAMIMQDITLNYKISVNVNIFEVL